MRSSAELKFIPIYLNIFYHDAKMTLIDDNKTV